MTLLIDKVQQIEGVTVYGDDSDFSIYYLVPQQPRYRLNPDGTPAFRFLKYRFPIDRADGRKGGGAVLFDAEFVVPEDKMPKIMEVLTAQVQQEANRQNVQAPPVKIGTITYTKGEVKLFVIGADGTFVEKLHNPGKPSLYGNNITTFMLEFTPEGATFFEQAMQGQGGAVSVVYDLHFWAKLPPVTINAWFNASKFYSFYQTIDVDWHLWSEDDYRETLRETMISSESMGIEPNWGGLTDEKIKTQLRDWAFRSLEDAVERNMIQAIAPVPEDQRNMPEGIENVTRDISNFQISSFNLFYKEHTTVEWNLAPQGQLQNITNLQDKDGNLLRWEDYAKTIDLDDPFFRQLRVNTYVNADFNKLPIHSVEVKLLYDGRPMPNLAPDAPEGEVVLRKPDEIGHFATYVENDNWKYKYSYQVNYKGESQIFQSEEVETNEGNLTIGVDDIGILSVNVSAGDINWNDVDSVLVTLKYEDPNEGVEPFEDQFTLTKALPNHLVQEVIFKPMRKSYKYFVKYFMKDGKELEGDEGQGRAENLFIQDPFGGRKTVGIRGVGDFVNRISQVYLDLKYVDVQNDNYTQAKSIALSKDTPFFDWSFPVISPTLGKVVYSGTVVFKDGTIQPIAETTAATDTILVPKAPQDVLEVAIVPDLLDWTKLRLVKVSLQYQDADNEINETKDFILTPQRRDMQTWKVELKDKTKNQFTYKVVYYLTNGTQKAVSPPATTDNTVILEIPES
jgi:hypothetical protein